MNRNVLVVDDDRKTVELIRLYLERDRYNVSVAYDGRRALELARSQHPDLVVLDLMLPEIDGVDVCRTLQTESQVPIIMLTARSTEEDMLLGLELGADDYMTKPFSPRELVARVRAVLRRTHEEAEQPAQLRVGRITLDRIQHEARLDARPLHLTPKEFRLLETLMNEPGRAFSRLELLERVFGFDYAGLERTVDVHVMNLRRKVESDAAHPRYIQTVYGVGYKFVEKAHVP
jgi:DNA-binding response OmpR family regulator